MKILRLLFVSLLLSGSAWAAPAFVQDKVRTVAGVTNTAFTSPITAGNSVFMCISYASADSVTTNPKIVGGAGTINLTQGPTATVSGVTLEIWYTHNVSGGQTNFQWDTFFETRLNTNASEWSGLSNAGPITNNNTGIANATVTTNSVTPGAANNLVIAMGGWTANDYSTGPTNSFNRMTQTGGGAVFQEAAYLIQSAATAQSTGWGLTAGVNWAAAIAVFGAPASGPTPAQRSAGFFMVSGM